MDHGIVDLVATVGRTPNPIVHDGGYARIATCHRIAGLRSIAETSVVAFKKLTSDAGSSFAGIECSAGVSIVAGRSIGRGQLDTGAETREALVDVASKLGRGTLHHGRWIQFTCACIKVADMFSDALIVALRTIGVLSALAGRRWHTHTLRTQSRKGTRFIRVASCSVHVGMGHHAIEARVVGACVSIVGWERCSDAARKVESIKLACVVERASILIVARNVP